MYLFYRNLRMTKETLIKQTLNSLTKLPQEMVKEVHDFTDQILNKHTDQIIQKGIEKLISDSKTFEFLKHEEDLYSLEDLKEKF